jgi:Protein of unknown function (DUF2568)
MAIANLTIRFLVELAGIAAFGYWGLQATSSPLVAIAAMALAAVAWGLVVAPKARNRLAQSQRDIVGTAILLVASGALAAAGQPLAGIALALVVILNAVALRALGPAARDAFAASPGRAR